MASAMSDEDIRINLPEPIYELINFVPRMVRDKNAKALGAAVVMGNKEAAEKRMQAMVSAMMELHISQDDEHVLENLVDSINMLKYKVVFTKKQRVYKPYSSNNETRTASKPIPAEEICQSVEFSGLRIDDESAPDYKYLDEETGEGAKINPLGYEPKQDVKVKEEELHI
jgi:hypothetical protein